MASNLLPLLLVGGAAVAIAGGKKKPKKKKKKKQPEDLGMTDDGLPIVDAGEYEGYSWRVAQKNFGDGFADRFLAQVQAPGAVKFITIDDAGHTNVENARLVCLEHIAKTLEQKADDAEKGGEEIVLEGEYEGWQWRVRKAKEIPGFAQAYFGDVRPNAEAEWQPVHKDPRTDPDQCRLLALEKIAIEESQAGA